MKRKLARQATIVGATGDGPQPERVIRQMIVYHGGFVGDLDLWQEEQIIVLGQRSFNESYLEVSMEMGRYLHHRCVYLAQEDFFRFLSDGRAADYHEDDPRFRRYPAFSVLSKLGFRWPLPYQRTSSGYRNWANESPLKAVYNYKVGGGVSKDQRRIALRQAIRPDALGLREAANHIKSMIITNWKNPLMSEPVDDWIYDFDWLHDTFYKGSVHEDLWYWIPLIPPQ